LDRRLGGPQSLSGHGGEEKIFQPLLGLEPLIIQPIAQHYTTELYLGNKLIEKPHGNLLEDLDTLKIDWLWSYEVD
jgi:hypothetical protein